MSYGGDTADMLVREGIQVTEAAVKLAALGAKNLAALLLAMAKKDERSLSGVTDILQMFQNGDSPEVVTLKKEQLGRFMRTVKDFKLPYKPLTDKSAGTTDIIFRKSDLALMLRVLERAGFAVPERDVDQKGADEKNRSPRAPSESKSTGRGSGLTASTPKAGTDRPGHRAEGEKPSVVNRVEAIKRGQAALRKEREQHTKRPPTLETTR